MRRVLVTFAAVSVAVGALVSISSSAGAAGPPLTQYLVYGENGVVVGNGSTVTGLIGARNGNPSAGGYAVVLEGSAKVIGDPATSVVGDARTAGDTHLLNGALIQGTLIHTPGTAVDKAATASIGSVVATDPELPTLPPATPVPGGCPTNGPNDGGANNQTRTIGPGTRGDWNFNGGLTINFTTSGTYVFNSIHAANVVTLHIVPGVFILVCDVMQMGGSVKVLPATSAQSGLKVEAQGTDNLNTFRAGGGTRWIGNVYTPNGGIHIGSGGSASTVLGQLWAGGQVDLEHGVKVVGSPPGSNNGPSALHFVCYELKRQPPGVGAVVSRDQFGTNNGITLGRGHEVCNPADKNGEDPQAPSNPNHLVGYEADSTGNPAQGHVVEMTNQFGRKKMTIAQLSAVDVPSAKSLTGPPPPLTPPTVDHFNCYAVKLSGGFTKIKGVAVTDEFGSFKVDLVGIRQLCAPADVNDPQGTAHTDAIHYVCYRTELSAGQSFKPPTDVWINNEFMAKKVQPDGHVDMLCVPSTKTILS